MGQMSRTLSFLKRNGLKATVCAVTERLGWLGPDSEQMRASAYGGPVDEPSRQSGHEKAEVLENITNKYRFSIVVPAYETDVVFLREMIDSVCAQTYPYWQLVIADASKSDGVAHAIEAYTDERICYLRLKENKGISENTNEAVKQADGDYIGLLDHDDVLHPEALMEVASFLQGGSYEMVYTDEDKISGDGSRCFEPNFKPDFNFDFLLSNNYICHFTVLSKKLMGRISFRPAFNGAQDYDLFLQAVYEIERMHREEIGMVPQEDVQALCLDESYLPYDDVWMKQKIGHIPKILYRWRAHMGSTSDNPESKRYAYEAGKRALEQFASKNGWDVSVKHTKHLGFYEIEYHPDIFSVRRDVAAVCGKVVSGGKIVAGPVMDGKQLFSGMNANYGGYMHRAVLKFDADSADERCIRYRKDISAESVPAGARMVYQPDYTVRKQR